MTGLLASATNARKAGCLGRFVLAVLCSAVALDGYAADVTFRWDYLEAGPAGFAIYCGGWPGGWPGGYPTRIDAGNTDTFTLGVAAGSVVFCAVRAYDAYGAESSFSNEVAIAVSKDTGTVAVQPRLSVVQGSTAPTATGVRVVFSRPFDRTLLNLYASAAGQEGPADVTLVGATSGPVRGSLVLDADSLGLTFVKTGDVLLPDTYTLTIASRFDGLVDTLGRPVDGNGDGMLADYHLVFTVAPSATPVLSMGEFARGPGQQINLPNTDKAAGIPVRIGHGAAVHDVAFTLRYNPALLSVQDVRLDSAINGSLTLGSIDPAAGLVSIHVSNISGLTDASTVLLRFQAQVPATAPYRSQHVLDLGDIQLNAGALPGGRDDDGVHLVANLGDASGLRRYSSLDALLIQRVIVGLDSGFSAYPLTDPILVGDVNSSGQLESADGVLIQLKALRRTVLEIPD